jgi:Transcriptional repressor TCF25
MHIFCVWNQYDTQQRLYPTAFATCRFVLSLDPLRDPLYVLLVIDRFLLAKCFQHSNNQDDTIIIEHMKWLIHIVDHNVIPLLHRPNSSSSSIFHHGAIHNLPNWSFSYAYALFQLYTICDWDENMALVWKHKADMAIRKAIKQYPLVWSQILRQLNIDVTGRSFRQDWYTVLEYTSYWSDRLDIEWSSQVDDHVDQTILLSATNQTCEKIIKNYVLHCSQYWNREDTLQWVYENLNALYNEYKSSSSDGNTMDVPTPPSPAIIRYINCDLSVYDNNVTTLPADIAAAMIDGGLLAQAVNHMDTNRPRFIRQIMQHHRRGGGGGGANRFDPDDRLLEELAPGHPHNRESNRRGFVLGGPPTEIINPDWPILELFWRSFLPWTHVDGISPPARPPGR